MDKEKLTERFEKIEEHLKERLKEVQERMLVKD
jgi:4-aminobutyrate aminotransferase-like enzyme